MDYSTFNTRTIEKMLDAAAAGSAEHKALQAELLRREQTKPHKDTKTLLLFEREVWEGIH
jgi:hypothetical protein